MLSSKKSFVCRFFLALIRKVRGIWCRFPQGYIFHSYFAVSGSDAKERNPLNEATTNESDIGSVIGDNEAKTTECDKVTSTVSDAKERIPSDDATTKEIDSACVAGAKTIDHNKVTSIISDSDDTEERIPLNEATTDETGFVTGDNEARATDCVKVTSSVSMSNVKLNRNARSEASVLIDFAAREISLSGGTETKRDKPSHQGPRASAFMNAKISNDTKITDQSNGQSNAFGGATISDSVINLWAHNNCATWR